MSKVLKFLKRIVQPSSLGGMSAIAIALPAIVNGISPDTAKAVAEGLNTTAGGLSAGLPLWQAILIGALGGAAIARDDKTD